MDWNSLSKSSLSALSPKMYKCTLMCKDRELLQFDIGGTSDFIIENVIEVSKSLYNKFNLYTVLNGRLSIINRKGIEDYLYKLGLRTKVDILRFTQGVSLSDCLWLKFEDSTMDWSNINPYIQNHSFDVNWLLEGLEITANVLPNYSTHGQFPKCWITEHGTHKLIKCGTSVAWNSGLEPLGDILSSQIADGINYRDYVKYNPMFIEYEYKEPGLVSETLCNHNGRFASVCNNFTDEHKSLISASELGLFSYEECFDFISGLGLSCNNLCYILLCDCISMNEDRHMGNIGFLYNPDTMDILGTAPMFDCNLSLMPYWEDRINVHEYRQQLRAKDNSTFEQLYTYVCGKMCNIKDILHSIDIELQSELIVSNRLDVLNTMIKYNIDVFKRLK